MRLLIPLFAAASLAAAVPGVPEAGPNGVLPFFGLTSSNDMFGSGVGNGDDFRTAGVALQGRLGGWVVATEGSMLTDRRAGTRADQAQLLAGRVLGDQTPHAGWHASVLVGGGVQLDGNLGGRPTQNFIHDTIGASRVGLNYDREDSQARPLFAVAAVAGWLGEPSRDLGLTGWWGGQVLATTSWVPDAELLSEIGPRLVLVGAQGALWLGVRVRLRDGEPPTATAGATGAHEDGWWLDAGTYITPLDWDGREFGWQVRAAINPETQAALGSLGLVVSPGAGPGGATLDLSHDLAVYGGGGFGVQLRWHPWPYQDARRSSAVLDYRFGSEPDGRLRLFPDTQQAADADLRHDQWTIGWEEAYRSPNWSGVRFMPWVQGGAGLRHEGMVIDGASGRWREGSSTAPVLRAAVGVRAAWHDLVSLGASCDGWLPAWQTDHPVGGAQITLNDPGWALGLHLAAHIAW